MTKCGTDKNITNALPHTHTHTHIMQIMYFLHKWGEVRWDGRDDVSTVTLGRFLHFIGLPRNVMLIVELTKALYCLFVCALQLLHLLHFRLFGSGHSMFQELQSNISPSTCWMIEKQIHISYVIYRQGIMK